MCRTCPSAVRNERIEWMNNLQILLSSDAFQARSLQNIMWPKDLALRSHMDSDTLWCSLKAKELQITSNEFHCLQEKWLIEDRIWLKKMLDMNFLLMPPCQCIAAVWIVLEKYTSICGHYKSLRHFRNAVLIHVSRNIEIYIEAFQIWTNLYALIEQKTSKSTANINAEEIIKILSVYEELQANYLPILSMFGLVPLECRVKKLIRKYIQDLVLSMQTKVELYGNRKFQSDEMTCFEVAMDLVRCLECVLGKVDEICQHETLQDLVDERPLREYTLVFIDFFYHILFSLYRILLYKPSSGHKVFDLIALWRVQVSKFIRIFPGTSCPIVQCYSSFIIEMTSLAKSYSTELRIKYLPDACKHENIECLTKAMTVILNLVRLRGNMVNYLQSYICMPSFTEAIEELEGQVRNGKLFYKHISDTKAVYSSTRTPFMELDISEDASRLDDYFITVETTPATGYIMDSIQPETLTLKCHTLISLQLLYQRDALICSIFPYRPEILEFSENIQLVDKHLVKCVENLVEMKKSLVDTIAPLSQIPSEYLITRIAELALRYIQKPINTNASDVIKSLINCLACWVNAMCSQGQIESKAFVKSSVINLNLLLKALQVNDTVYNMDEESYEYIQEQVSCVISLLLSHFEVCHSEETENRVENGCRSIWDVERERDLFLQEAGIIGKAHDFCIEEDMCRRTREDKVDFEWRRLHKIGDGANGTVYQCLNLNTGKLIAVKQVKISDQVDYSYILREGRLMQTLRHPNIVSCYGIEVTVDAVNIFMEYCPGGTLLKLIAENGIGDESLIQQLLLQLVRGLAYLHDKGIVHGDVKPQNIFFDQKGNIRLGDFGAACNFREENVLKSLVGTPSYLAPECLLRNYVDTAGDIWSLGCTLLHMITGKRPWSQFENEWTLMFHLGREGNLPNLPDPATISPQLNNIFRKCLTRDPTERPTAKALLSMPFLSRAQQIV